MVLGIAIASGDFVAQSTNVVRDAFVAEDDGDSCGFSFASEIAVLDPVTCAVGVDGAGYVDVATKTVVVGDFFLLGIEIFVSVSVNVDVIIVAGCVVLVDGVCTRAGVFVDNVIVAACSGVVCDAFDPSDSLL